MHDALLVSCLAYSLFPHVRAKTKKYPYTLLLIALMSPMANSLSMTGESSKTRWTAHVPLSIDLSFLLMVPGTL